MYNRKQTIGASDAVHIWAGEWSDLYDRKMSGEPLRGVLPAAIGHELEPFHRRWFDEYALTGVASEYESPHAHEIIQAEGVLLFEDQWADSPLHWSSQDSWCCYLPDGLIRTDTFGQVPLELKAVNPFWRPANLLDKYMPQLQHAMRVCNAPLCVFSVLYLNIRWEWEVVTYDPAFDDELLKLERAFLWHLQEEVRP